MNQVPSKPPTEDSEDFSDQEARLAIVTKDSADFSSKVSKHLMLNVGARLKRHELRRWKAHLYHRSIIENSKGVEEGLVFRIDWMQRGQEYER